MRITALVRPDEKDSFFLEFVGSALVARLIVGDVTICPTGQQLLDLVKVLNDNLPQILRAVGVTVIETEEVK
jgi:hypothetical protein